MDSAAEFTAFSNPVVLRRPVDASDAPFLRTAYASTRSAEMAMVPWTAEQKDHFVASQFAAQCRYYASEYPDATHELLLVDDIPVGRIYLAVVPDGVHILDLIVLPEFRGRGIGTTVLTECQDLAQSLCLPIEIYVDAITLPRRLFVTLGFVPKQVNDVHVLFEWSPSPQSA